MDKSPLTEDDIRQLFHASTQPSDGEKDGFAVQKSPPELPRTTQCIGTGVPANPAKPISPLHTKSAASPLHNLPPIQPTTAVATVSPDAYLPAKSKYHSKPQRLVRAMSMFGVAFFFSFGLLNGGTYTSRVGYWWQTDIRGQEAVTPEEIQRLTGGNTLTPDVSIPSPSPPPSSSSPPSQSTSRLPATPVTLPQNRMIIPKIGVDAPVVWNADPGNILKDLQKGVAHYAGTALPNGDSGNTFVTGHSSGFVWDRSPYTTVFANLDKLVAGDLIAVTTDNEEYIYRVKDSIVVRPQETSVLGPTPIPMLSLMTCVPVGTNLRRLIVRADLIRVVPLAETRQGVPL